MTIITAMTSIKFVYLFIIWLSFSFITNANESIVWLTDTGRIADNFYSKEKSSLGVETTRMILQKLNLADVDIKVTRLVKIQKIMATKSPKKTYCVAGRIKNSEREQTQIFSQPNYLYPNLKIFYNEGKNIPPHYLNKEGKLISLPSFFNSDSEHVLTIERNRSYGNFLDKQINLISEENLNIEQLKGSNMAIISMLLRSKIEYTLLYPTSFNRKINLLKNYKLKLKSTAIDGNPPYIFSRIACSKNELGRKMITNINRILDELYLSEDFYNIHTQFLQKSEHIQFKKDLEQLLNDKALL